MKISIAAAFMAIGILLSGMQTLSAEPTSRPIDPEITFNRQWAERAFSDKLDRTPTAGSLQIVHEDYAGETKIGRCTGGGPMKLGGKTYTRGIGVNARSVVRVSLHKPADRFIADIGIDRNADGKPGGSAQFHVTVSDKDLLKTDVLRANGKVQQIDVKLNGAKTFDLIVSDGGDGRDWDQADWADAKVIYQDGSEAWLNDIAEQGQIDSDLPFSFVYGGKPSSEFIRSWKSKAEDEKIDAGTLRRTLTLTDPVTGLEVKTVASIYTDTAGIDWILYFKNTGDKDTPVIEQVKAVDVSLNPGMGGPPVLHRLHGSTGCVAFTYDDFQPYDEALPAAKKIEFGASGASPSFEVSPFYNLQWQGGGVITAVGWTGHWGASVDHPKEGPIRMEAGMRAMHLKLHSGESIRSPRILQLYWFGKDEQRSYNLFRHTMLSHIVPKIDGKTVEAPIAHMTSSFYENNDTTEKIEKDYINSFKDLGFECYWLDAWWFKGGFPAGIGHYGFPISRVVATDRFPNGLKPLGDIAHKAGMKFLVWFCVENVYPNTILSKEHPEWVLKGGADDPNGDYNLGIPEAREYMTRYLNTAIKEYGIDCYRTDGGPSFGHWTQNDKDPDRAGMTEIRYIEGLYRMCDDVRAANPHLFIDNCSGGGTRIDLERCARSIPLWRTDGAVWSALERKPDQAAIQNQAISSALNRYVPISTEGQAGAEPYYFRSGFNGGMAFTEDTRPADYPKNLLTQAITEAKRIRKYFVGDFYPISRVTADADAWCVLQYHRPDEQDGIVLAFRRHQSAYGTYTCSLRDIDPNAHYKVTKSRTYKPSKPVIMKGSALAKILLKIDECPGSLLIEYEKLRRDGN